MLKKLFDLKWYHFIRFLWFVLFTILIISYTKITLILTAVIIVIVFFVVFINNHKLLKRATGNGLISGARGSGKGVLLNHIIRKDKTKPFCNVEYGNSELLENIGEYLNSLSPNTSEDFINGTVKYVKKLEKFEGRNVYIDDINVYMANWQDSLLKKKYTSAPPFLAINRHTYNAHMIATTQDFERPWKILRELQSDFIIEVQKTNAFNSGFWLMFPFLHRFIYTKYIYYERKQAVGKLPFKAVGAVNEGLKHGYLTSGQATKEIYEAENGVISYGFVLQLKKHLKYDTRYFHKVVYGVPAPKE